MQIVRFTIRTTAIREWREQRRVAQRVPDAGTDGRAEHIVDGGATARGEATR